MKRLLIIGGGEEQIPAYQLAKSKGLEVVGTDININAPASVFADHFLKASTRDIDETLNCVKEFNAIHKINGVMTIANDVPMTVATVAEELNLNSISTYSAALSTNKLEMKKKFLDHGVPCPNYHEINNLSELQEVIKSSENTFVLKPIDGCGARGVLVLSRNDDIEAIFNNSKSFTASSKLLLEEYIEGLQISSESFLINGRAYTPALAERNYSRLTDFLPNIIEDGGTIPPPVTEEVHKEINLIIEIAAKSIGVSDGVIKGDIVIDKAGNIKIIEIATRLSGGWFCSHQIPAATGVDLVDINIDYALGLEIDPKRLRPSKNLSTSIRYFFSQEGTIKHIDGIEDLKKARGLLKYDFFRATGDYQPKINKHSDRLGYVICIGNNRSESLGNALHAISLINVAVE